jgi:hypothetical protein
LSICGGLLIRQFPLHFTANVAEAGLATEPAFLWGRLPICGGLLIRQFPLHFTANVAEAGLATEPTLRMMGTLFPEAAPEGTRTLTWLSPRGHPGVWRRGCAPWATFVGPRIFADHSDGGGKTPVEMQAKANTVHLKGGIPTLPGWPFGVVDLPKVRYGDKPSA